MATESRDITGWINSIVTDERFPILHQQLRQRIHSANPAKSEDSAHSFNYKSGKRECVDDVLAAFFQMSIAHQEQAEQLDDFAVDPEVHSSPRKVNLKRK